MSGKQAGMKWKQYALATVIVGMLAGCASEEDSIVVAPLPKLVSEFTPIELWETKVGKGIGSYVSDLIPVYAYDKLYVAARDGEVAALSPETGEPLWQIDLGKEQPIAISAGLTAAYDAIFLGTESGKLMALNAEDGTILWEANAEGEILAKPHADEDLIVVNTSRGELAAYDAFTGEQRWKIATDVPTLTLRGDSAPTSAGGGVFWGMANGRLGAALLSNGNVIWQQPIAAPKGASEIDRLVDVDANPLIAGTTLFAVGYNGKLVAIDLRSGRAVWQRPYSTTKDLIIDGETLYLADANDILFAVDARSGTELWQNAELKNRQLTAPSLIDGYLVLGDSEGYLHWLDTTTGEFVAQQKVKGDGIASAPLVLDERFLVVTRDGKLRLQTLTAPVAQMSAEQSISSESLEPETDTEFGVDEYEDFESLQTF